MKGETDRTEEEASPLKILFRHEIIIFIPRNNEILKLRSISITKMFEWQCEWLQNPTQSSTDNTCS